MPVVCLPCNLHDILLLCWRLLQMPEWIGRKKKKNVLIFCLQSAILTFRMLHMLMCVGCYIPFKWDKVINIDFLVQFVVLSTVNVKNFRPVQISTFSPRGVKNKFSSMINFDQRAWLQLKHTCIRSYFFDFFKMVEKDEIFYGLKISTFTVSIMYVLSTSL